MSIFNKHVASSKDASQTVDTVHSRQGIHHELEERRLAYVAWTRARHDLLLLGSWIGATSVTPRDPSRYLMETVNALGLDEDTIAARPEEDIADQSLVEIDPRLRQYPILPGRSRQLVNASATRVQELIDTPTQLLDAHAKTRLKFVLTVFPQPVFQP